MNAWPFVITAYVITIGATLITTVIALRAARGAETRAGESRAGDGPGRD